MEQEFSQLVCIDCSMEILEIELRICRLLIEVTHCVLDSTLLKQLTSYIIAIERTEQIRFVNDETCSW